MTGVTIHPGGAAMSTVAKRLVALAGGDTKAVRASGTGLTVSPELAYRYLAASLNGHAPDVSSAPVALVPPGLAEVVRGAEDQAGLIDSSRAPARADGARGKRAPRKTTTTTATEE